MRKHLLRLFIIPAVMASLLFPGGCGEAGSSAASSMNAASMTSAAGSTAEESSAASHTWEAIAEDDAAGTGLAATENGAAGSPAAGGTGTAAASASEDGTAAAADSGTADSSVEDSDEVPEEEKLLVVLDPGHTAHLSGGTEPNGPGSSVMKDKDTLGTAGVSTGLHEYELNLQVCEKLRKELEKRNYRVILTHESNDTEMSCIERAEVANDNDADLFLRVHADGSTSSAAQGGMTISITKDNPYHPELYAESYRLSETLINRYCEVTGRKSRGVWQTDTMTGSNWSEVPCTLIEMGFMTNPEEDEWMASAEGQKLIVQGIADGVDSYFDEADGSDEADELGEADDLGEADGSDEADSSDEADDSGKTDASGSGDGQ